MDHLTAAMHLTCRDSHLQRLVLHTHVSEQIQGHTTRTQLLSKLCAWIQDHALLHEHSNCVSTAILDATENGVFGVPPDPEYVSMDTPGIVSPLRIAVQSRIRGPQTEINLGIINISTAVEPGSVACPAYTYVHAKSSLNTDIQAMHITCTKGHLEFTISTYVVPQRKHCVFAQSFLEVGGVSSLLPKCSEMYLKNQFPMARCESHRDHRVYCKHIHMATIHKIGYPHGNNFPNMVMCNPYISLYSTRGPNKDAIHTVFFK